MQRGYRLARRLLGLVARKSCFGCYSPLFGRL
jgi:hypothetical protein